jgi:hypothetical protein
MNFKRLSTPAALVALLASLAPTTIGQTIDGNIVGSVTDASGAAIAGASVETVNPLTGVKTSTATDGSGNYRFGNLPVATYTVTASAKGFKPRAINGVPVSLNLTSTVNVVLQVGDAASVVDVTDSVALIDASTAQVTNTYTAQYAATLPITAAGGGVLNLSLLGAGVGSGGGVGVGTGPSVGGQRPRNNSFTIEGVDNNRKDVTGPVISPPNDSVAEFTILQNQFSAEFGHSSGGQFNTVLISGTNQIHGGIWEYLRNRKLNAYDQSFARQYVGTTLPRLPRYDQNRLGARIGGAVIKNKLFYFGTYEYNPTGQASTPSSASYAPTADGYAKLASISTINPTNLAILKQYAAPAPVQAAGKLGTTTVAGVAIPIGVLPISAPNYTNVFKWMPSVDYILSDRDQMHARYIDQKTATIDTSANLPILFTPRPITAHLGAFSEFHNFSPTLINEFRLAYNRYNDNIVVPDFKYPGLDAFPNIGINNDLNLTLGPDANAPQGTIQSTYQLVDNVTWIRGKHEFKFGFDGRDLIAASTFIQRVRGDYEYSTLDLFLRDQFPDQLAQRNVGGKPYSGNQTAYYGFANDNYKVRRNLTINLGVRYEFNGVAQSMREFDLNAIASTPGVLTFAAPKAQKLNFAPRVGFAYSPGNSGSTSIRGGFGIAYDQIFDNVGTNARPPQATATVDSSPNAYPNGGYLASGGIHSDAVSGTLTAAQAKAATSAYLPDQKLGYAITWNLGIQRVFHKDYTFEARYIGNRGVHLLYQNQINRAALVTPTNSLPLFYSDPSSATLNALTLTLAQLQASSSIRNNLFYGSGYQSTITGYLPIGNSSYHGLALELGKRFADHILFKGAYTWSHLIDDSTAEVNSTTLSPRRAQDFQNLKAERASSALDRRQRFTFTSIYEVPWFSKSDNWMAKNLLGNWQASAVYTYETPEWGTPQSATDSNLNGDSAGDRVVLNPNGVAGTSSDVTALTNSAGATVAYRVNNPNAQFIRARAGIYANSGRNILPTRPINNIDFNMSKTVAIRERVKFEFRADFFNLLNHAQFTPGSVNTVNATSRSGVTNYLTPGNALFGQFDQVYSSNPRNIQLGAKLTF